MRDGSKKHAAMTGGDSAGENTEATGIEMWSVDSVGGENNRLWGMQAYCTKLVLRVYGDDSDHPKA